MMYLSFPRWLRWSGNKASVDRSKHGNRSEAPLHFLRRYSCVGRPRLSLHRLRRPAGILFPGLDF
jgi:hypothetical protein